MGAREDALAELKPQFIDAQSVAVDAFGNGMFDKGEAVGTGPGFTQADVDAAVKAAVDPLNAQVAKDATDLAAAIQAGVDQVAAVQASLDAMTSKELQEEGVVQGLKDAVAAFQAVLAGLPQKA